MPKRCFRGSDNDRSVRLQADGGDGDSRSVRLQPDGRDRHEEAEPTTDNYLTFSDRYGKQIEHWNGVDVGVNARLRNGLTVQGGLSTGRTTLDNCEIVAKLPESLLAGPNLGSTTR